MSEAKNYSDAINAFDNVDEMRRVAEGRWFDEEKLILADNVGDADLQQCLDAAVARINVLLSPAIVAAAEESCSND